ncbi:MAG: Holliday junction branch migration DNA helicase RuvB [Acholeplasmatales bacterium]|jgi:Holliday junction DNA helicase RuvB|nr:Holliday junction branch migration DNA helicase RuvB [Acholeplasmatales bacterium]
MERTTSAALQSSDVEDRSLRPQYLADFVAQQETKELLSIYIKAAKARNETIDHLLFYGPPGLGKTTLANIVANEMGVNIKITSGPVIEKAAELAAILTSLKAGDILFIDEIHRLPKIVEEVLYSAMEDYQIDIVIGTGDETRSIRIDLEPFTLIGATTRYGDLTAPLRERFGIVRRLDFYKIPELNEIIQRTSKLYNVEIAADAALLLARCSRGTPRVANRLFRRIRDFAEVLNKGVITLELTRNALIKQGVNISGLDEIDRHYLEALILKFNGGPVGLNNIATSIGEEEITISEAIEPYLIQEGYVERTKSGRLATKKAWDELNIKESLINKKK